MSQVLEIIKRARQSGDISELVEWIPYSEFLGISVTSFGDEIIGKMTFDQRLIGNALIPALHGGTVGALLESTSIFTTIMHSDTLRVPKTINITVEYLRTGRAQDVFARAEFTKVGRRVANVRSYAWQDERDRPIAVANAHFLWTVPQDGE